MSSAKAFYSAVTENQLANVVNMVEQKRFDVASIDYNGSLALHWACSKGHMELVRYFVEMCKKNLDVDAINSNGWTALHVACRFGHLEVVQYLVESGQANIEAVTNADDWTAMHIACRYGHLDVVEYLEKRGTFAAHVLSALDLARSWGFGKVCAYLESRIALGYLESICSLNKSVSVAASTTNTRPSTKVLIELNQLDEEYWQVARRLEATMPQTHIARVWKVHNTALSLYYAFHKQRFALNGIDANEATVWHGTSEVDPSVIYNDKQDGFMMQCAKKGMWGYVCLFELVYLINANRCALLTLCLLYPAF